MKATLNNLSILIRRHPHAVKFMAVALVVITWGGFRYENALLHQPPHARQRAKTMYDRAAGICTVLGEACAIETRPAYVEKSAACYQGDNAPLRMWKFLCNVDGRQMAMIFNDDTGGLCYLITERTHPVSPMQRPLAPIDTPEEAAEVGFQRLKAMKILPPGMLIALRGAPNLSSIRSAWEMTWSVKRAPHAAPYTIRLVLDRFNHMPLSMADTSNQNAPPHRHGPTFAL